MIIRDDIVIAGVGGQGILTIASIVGQAAVAQGLNVKQSEVHGMAQRGGAVVAHLRISSETIFSDLVPAGQADVLLAVEPLEALRHVNFLAEDGMLLANEIPVENIPNYPDIGEVLRHLRQRERKLLINAGGLAREAGSSRCMNVVMIGALSAFIDLSEDLLKETIEQAFARKGEHIVNTNLAAFAAGRAAGLEARNAVQNS